MLVPILKSRDVQKNYGHVGEPVTFFLVLEVLEEGKKSVRGLSRGGR